ncbi:MAG: ABC transporter permease [Verrucomicrobia bacterium]|nr:ABC transporter permease [Verrucomicrobiota bacterium]
MKQKVLAWLGNGALVAGLIYCVLFAVYAGSEKGAVSLFSIATLFNNAAPLALAAAGETIVVLTKNFDLSVGGVISLTNVILAVYPIPGPYGAAITILVVCLLGALVGAVNGALVAYGRLQSIGATLGTMIVCQGLALVILGAPGGNVSDFIANFFTDQIFGFPVAALVLLLVAFVWIILKTTDLGVAIYAIGQDEAAARLSGISVSRTRFLAYCLAGCVYALAGFMLSAQTATGNPTAGSSFSLLVFASVVIGGTSLLGGRGGLIGSMIGAAALTLLQKVLFSTGVESFYIGVFQGVIMIAALAFSETVFRVSRLGASSS